MSKCSVKDCPHEANAGDKCWEHLTAGYDVSTESYYTISDRFKKRMVMAFEGNGKPLPFVEVPPQPTADVEVTSAEVERAIEKVRTENDLLAVLAGKNTMHLLTADVKKMGIWSIVSLLSQIVISWLKGKQSKVT